MVTPEHSPTSLPKVLVVDDEQRVLNAMRMMFRHRFELFLAEDERAALDIVRRHAIDVIVADQQMPHVSGIELLAKVRVLSPQTAGILMSEYTDLSAIEDSINKIGAFRVLTKPCAPSKLRVAIELAMRAVRARDLDPEPLPPPAPVVIDPQEQLAHDILSQEAPAQAIEAWSSRVQDQTSTTAEDALAATDVIVPEDGAAVTSFRRHVSQSLEPKVAASGVLVFTTDADLVACVEQVAAGQFPVFVSSNIVQVVRLLADEQPGVLVTDISHDRDTIQAMTANLKRHLPELVTILLAEQYDPSDMAWLINHGQVFRILRKPLSAGRCAVALQAALQHLETLRSGIVPDDADPDAREDSGVMSGVFERLKAVKRLLA